MYHAAAFWQCADCSETMKGVRNAVSIFLSTGYCIGSVLAILLNAILPEDAEEPAIEGNASWSVIGQKSAYFEKETDEAEGEVSNRGTVKDEEAGSANESGEGDDAAADDQLEVEEVVATTIKVE